MFKAWAQPRLKKLRLVPPLPTIVWIAISSNKFEAGLSSKSERVSILTLWLIYLSRKGKTNLQTHIWNDRDNFMALRLRSTNSALNVCFASLIAVVHLLVKCLELYPYPSWLSFESKVYKSFSLEISAVVFLRALRFPLLQSREIVQ